MCRERRPVFSSIEPSQRLVLLACFPACVCASTISPNSWIPPKPQSISGTKVITDHIDGTECASCCDAFRKSWFPSLFSIVSHISSLSLSSSSSETRYRIGGGRVERTHFACLSAIKIVSRKVTEKPNGWLGIGNRTFGGKYGGKGDEMVDLVGDGVAGQSIGSLGSTKCKKLSTGGAALCARDETKIRASQITVWSPTHGSLSLRVRVCVGPARQYKDCYRHLRKCGCRFNTLLSSI